MADHCYKLTFRGEIAEGRQMDEVKENLSTLFKMSGEKIEGLFSGRPVTIKRDMDHETACKYWMTLQKAGVLCSVEVEKKGTAPKSPPVSEVPLRREEKEAPSERRKVKCPNCGHEGEDPVECIRCGIIFSRFQGKSLDGARKTGLPSCSIRIYDSAKEKKQIALLIFLLVLLGCILYYNIYVMGEIKYPPGILIASEPEQVIIEKGKPWRVGERIFVPLARFSLKARVLSTERYRFDPVSDISPIDLALGWGPMSDQSVLNQLEIGQGNRRFFIFPVRCCPPLPWPVIMSHSSNMHMIPANGAIEKSLKSIRRGELIALSGYLVGIREGGQWTWFSSLSRTDTGDGACEILWVNNLARL